MFQRAGYKADFAGVGAWNRCSLILLFYGEMMGEMMYHRFLSFRKIYFGIFLVGSLMSCSCCCDRVFEPIACDSLTVPAVVDQVKNKNTFLLSLGIVIS